MKRKTELTAVFLHQVEMNQPFFCSPSEGRAWVKSCPAGALSSPFASLPVQRSGIKTCMNGMTHVWVETPNA
jgi:hypothetical protein